MARLRVVSGPLAGQSIEVENELVIGRQDSDVTIDDQQLSQRHAVVRRHANRLQVEDLGSSDGTFVDGTRINEPTLLGGGAEIRVGTTVLLVEGVLPVQSQKAEAPVTGADTVPAGSADSIAPNLARQVTRVHTVPPPPSGQETPSTPPSPAPQAPVGEFRPPQRAYSRGLATRSWVPVALSFGTAIIVAIVLLIYFAEGWR
jgi:pSer/pThr/pTyr-binding forkhead associated (FHA) protein